MRFARSPNTTLEPLAIASNNRSEHELDHATIRRTSIPSVLDGVSNAAAVMSRRASSATNLSDSGLPPSMPSLNVLPSSGPEFASNAMLLCPSDGGPGTNAPTASTDSRASSMSDLRATLGTKSNGAPGAPVPRPLSATESHFPLSSPFLSHFGRRSVSPSRSVSPYKQIQRRDDLDATRPMLHGAAAGAHAAGDQRTQLYVRNLPPQVRWQDLKDLFRRAGTVLRADVHNMLHDPRYVDSGTVLFATEADAHYAIQILHGYNWHGHVLDVTLDDQTTSSKTASLLHDRHLRRSLIPMAINAASSAGSASAAATGPAVSSSAAAPLSATSQPSAASSSSTLMPPTTMASSSFSSLRDVPSSHAPVSDPWSRYSSPATAAPLPYPGRVLFVGNLPFHCQWQDLKDLFRAAGNIQRADVALNADGRSRGFGTVLFASPEDAQTAVRLYHGYEYSGRILKVHFDRYTHYGPVSFMVPTDPSQYTSAFHSRNVAPSNTMAPPLPPPLPQHAPQRLPVSTAPSAAPGFAASPFLHTVMPSQLHDHSMHWGQHIPNNATSVPTSAAAAASTAMPLPLSSEQRQPQQPQQPQQQPSPQPQPQFPLGSSAVPSSTTTAPASSDPAHHVPHPGRIAMPPVSFPPIGAMTPGVPLTPGMPGFILRSVLETPPIYPYMMSPGIALNTSGVSNGINSYLNAAPGAPVDMHPSMAMHNAHTNLPPTPHWAQPVQTRTYARSSSSHASTHPDPPVRTKGFDSSSPTVDQTAPVRAPQNEQEYPFPETDELTPPIKVSVPPRPESLAENHRRTHPKDNNDPREATSHAESVTGPAEHSSTAQNTHSTSADAVVASAASAAPVLGGLAVSPTTGASPKAADSSLAKDSASAVEDAEASVLPSTRELTHAIAKLSVRGTARTKRTDDIQKERVAAEAALSRLRHDLAAKDKPAKDPTAMGE